ncbi:MAG: hypothetical protein NVS4B10_06830 [Myxococcales bacterium]
MTDEAGPILSPEGIQEFFRSLLLAAIEHQNARVQAETEFYLVNLLAGFLQTETLYVREESGSLERKPLAFLLKEALEEEGAERLRRLRKLGDTSLFVSGFFSDSLSRSPVDVDYYIAMGERAYDALGSAVARRGGKGAGAPPSVFEELAEKFGLLVDLLNEVSERTLVSTNGGLVRLYDRFVKTGSLRLAGLLRREGVIAPSLLPVRGRFVQ